MASEFAPARQMAFHFTASNCIGCHSCEAACSEKNGLPSHIAWRKVGYVESGTFPDYRRMNISMACNHCEDPVCLKGCPTRAYVKYDDTGAVIQDSDVCFGCQYCTWVCPYGAPVFNPEAGTVSKCNFCVDRQAVGLNPACVDACLGHALDFGAKDELAARFDGNDITLPGFPSPAITRPNVRFQFDGVHAETYTRPDSMPLSYVGAGGSDHRPVPTENSGAQEGTPPLTWAGLQSSESPLVAFTLIAQGVVGAFGAFLLTLLSPARPVLDTIGGAFLLLLCGLLGYGLFTSTMHLGRPRYFYRAMNNLRHSWVSREILFMGGFMTLLCAFTGAWFLALPFVWAVVTGAAAAVFGGLGLFCMVKIYRIPARPYWNHTHTNVAFFASALILGPLALAAAVFFGNGLSGPLSGQTTHVLTACAGLALAAGVAARLSAHRHRRDLSGFGAEAGASRILLAGSHGRAAQVREQYATVLTSLLAMSLAAALATDGPLAVGLFTLAALIAAMVHETLDRFLFYLVVIPTTMPGALFLKNSGFEALARDTGLAASPTVGVVMDGHSHDAQTPRPAPPMRPLISITSPVPKETPEAF
ncbi:MAG: DmsC/YnfH family molybdoenzyme membrane anchor subunit [Leptospirillia bacterium]